MTSPERLPSELSPVKFRRQRFCSKHYIPSGANSRSPQSSTHTVNRMNRTPTEWRPLNKEELSEELAGVDGWFLCGGLSVALFCGSDTRAHGDIDIGVYRSELMKLLSRLERHRVFICCGHSHSPWDGGAVSDEVHHIWISCPSHQAWTYQIMIYDEADDTVFYRRDPRLSWPKVAHTICCNGVRILNPLVTLLYKTHKQQLRDKDVHDVSELIQRCALLLNESP